MPLPGERHDQPLLHHQVALTCLNPSGTQHCDLRGVDSLCLSPSSRASTYSFSSIHQTSMSEIDQQAPQASTRITTKPQRTLACASCQQRKVKCDRKFPCSTCIKSGLQCIPVAAPRRRRRRFPEAELLQRVRHLEDLLRQHNIDFEPLHGNVAEKGVAERSDSTIGKERRRSPEIKMETTFEAKYVHLLSKLLNSILLMEFAYKKSLACHESESATSSQPLNDGRSTNHHWPVSQSK